jgi:hypothetical protein
MKARRILAAVFLLPAVVSGYLAWSMWRAGDSGPWLFVVFTLFFVSLAIAPILPEFKPPPSKPPTSTRFLPHWFMMLAVLGILLAIILTLVGSIPRR